MTNFPGLRSAPENTATFEVVAATTAATRAAALGEPNELDIRGYLPTALRHRVYKLAAAAFGLRREQRLAQRADLGKRLERETRYPTGPDDRDRATLGLCSIACGEGQSGTGTEVGDTPAFHERVGVAGRPDR